LVWFIWRRLIFFLQNCFFFGNILCCTFEILFLYFGLIISSTLFLVVDVVRFLFVERMILLVNMIYLFSVTVPSFVLN
jgi:hypothetical protein